MNMSRDPRRWARSLIGLGVGLCLHGAAQAQDVRLLYPTAMLEKAEQVYAPNLHGMWAEDFLAKLTPLERKRAGPVSLDTPLLGLSKAPLTYYALPAQQRVVIPIASIQFLDDLSMAFSYYQAQGCDMGLVSDYVAALSRQAKPPAGTPRQALGVPDEAFQDELVNDTAMKALKSNVYFLMAHEYAHVMLHHQGYALISAKQAQLQEMQADDFALTVMRRIGVAPIAAVQFFLIASRLERAPGDFPDEASYQAYVKEVLTHPVSSARLHNLAAQIQAHLTAFAHAEPHPERVQASLAAAVPQLQEIARTLDDPKMRDHLARQAMALDAQALKTACKRSGDISATHP